MSISPEHDAELAQFPRSLQVLIAAELVLADNTIAELGHSHPAPPAGAYVRLARQITTRARESCGGLEFRDRSSGGEFTDAQRTHFVIDAPGPPPPPPDMDAIRAAVNAKAGDWQTPGPWEFDH